MLHVFSAYYALKRMILLPMVAAAVVADLRMSQTLLVEKGFAVVRCKSKKRQPRKGLALLYSSDYRMSVKNAEKIKAATEGGRERCPGHLPLNEYGIGDTKAYILTISISTRGSQCLLCIQTMRSI
jgi:hypothetical protein